MRDYELTVIINPEIADDDLPATIDKVSEFITQKGGAISETKQMGRRKLSYPINRFGEGSYVLTLFKLEPKLAAELEADLRMPNEVLRHLLVRAGE